MENTAKDIKDKFVAEDHLHIRGEYQTKVTDPSGQEGSPPHTWRIQVMSTQWTSYTGITSTYVENTLLLLVVDSSY